MTQPVPFAATLRVALLAAGFFGSETSSKLDEVSGRCVRLDAPLLSVRASPPGPTEEPTPSKYRDTPQTGTAR